MLTLKEVYMRRYKKKKRNTFGFKHFIYLLLMFGFFIMMFEMFPNDVLQGGNDFLGGGKGFIK